MNRKREISFLSEHSVELILATRSVQLLSHKYVGIIPINFLKTREGSRITQNAQINRSVAIISLLREDLKSLKMV